MNMIESETVEQAQSAETVQLLMRLWWLAVMILVVCVLVGIIMSIIRYCSKIKLFITFVKCVPVGIFASALLLLGVIYYYGTGADNVCSENFFRALIASFQHTMRLFTLDGDYGDFMQNLEQWDVTVRRYYMNYCVVLYAIAPMVTFGFVLTFIKNLYAYIHYYLCFFKETHVFSELNEMTLALAKNLLQHHYEVMDDGGDEADGKKRPFCKTRRLLRHAWKFLTKPLIVFTDVTQDKEESYLELVDGARDCGAILFRKDLESIHWRMRMSIRKLNFYLISEDEPEKIRHADNIIRCYNGGSVHMYFFAHSIEGKCYLDTLGASAEMKASKKKSLLITRIDDVRLLIYQYLKTDGIKLFENAEPAGDDRVIDVAILGFGRYGMEMLKGLLWYCQLPGYTIRIRVFEEKKGVESAFRSQCPELRIGEKAESSWQDARYEIQFYECSAESNECVKHLEALNKKSFVFICLGNDDLNIEAAKRVKCISENRSMNYQITTVVYNTRIKECVSNEFTVIGDLNSFYSPETVLASELAVEAMNVHARWLQKTNAEELDDQQKKDFFLSDYGFYSSVAKALHLFLRKNVYDMLQEALREEGDDRLDYVRQVFPFLWDQGDVSSRSIDTGKRSEAYWYRFVLKHTVSAVKANELYLFYDRVCTLLDAHSPDICGKTLLELEGEGKTAWLQTASAVLESEDLFVAPPAADKSRKGVFKNKPKRRNGKGKQGASVTDTGDIIDKPNASDLVPFATALAAMEHVRWNAYMRTEGFRPADNVNIMHNKKYKTHMDIVDVNKLTFGGCIKDI